jgi:hypothetical protein
LPATPTPEAGEGGLSTTMMIFILIVIVIVALLSYFLGARSK